MEELLSASYHKLTLNVILRCFIVTFGTQSFFILPSSGTLEHTQSYAPSSLPNVYFLLLTLNEHIVVCFEVSILFYLITTHWTVSFS